MRRFAIVLLAVCLGASCNDNPAGPSGGGNAILVFGSDMGAKFEHISLTRSGAAVTGAAVTVNGTPIPETSPGSYNGELPAFLNVGDTITLEIHAGSDVITGVAKIAAVPTITAPADGAVIHPGTPLAFAWTSPSDPNEFLAYINYQVGDSGLGTDTTVAGSNRTASVSTTVIPLTATGVRAGVFAYANGVFTGHADAGSKMHVRTEATQKNLVIQP